MEEIIVSIQGSGLSFTAKTDFFKAGQIIAFINTPQSSSYVNVTPNSLNTSQKSLLGSNRKAPRQMLIDSGAKTNAQKIVVLADYLLQDGGKMTFSSNELKPLFARAGESVPKNFSRDMKEAVIACYITESTEQSGEFELTEKASEMIQKKFQGEEIKKSRRKSNGYSGSSAGKKKEINNILHDIEISTVMTGYSDFHSLPTKGQKILWILTFAKNNGMDALNTSEIEFIADKLSDNITTSLFGGLNANNLKNGYIAKKGEKYKILQKGMDIISDSTN